MLTPCPIHSSHCACSVCNRFVLLHQQTPMLADKVAWNYSQYEIQCTCTGDIGPAKAWPITGVPLSSESALWCRWYSAMVQGGVS